MNPKGGCAREVGAESEDEVLRMVADHAKTMHKMAKVSPDMATKTKGAIMTGSFNV